MRTVKEVSELTGVSVRTLHHYDAIGLLTPTEVTQAGYRLYDDAALRRLRDILLFRELQFPLKEIKAILDSPQFDPAQALGQQIRLLELQYEHIGKLIAFAREIQQKGVDNMEFSVFDKSELEEYAQEAKARWGGTAAYQESERKSAKRSPDKERRLGRDMMALFTELGALRDRPPTDEAVQQKIAALRQFITEHYYPCTKDILQGLGQMYVADERFQKNIDRAGGDGTAEFVSRAIVAYCGN